MVGTIEAVDERELISRDELTEYLFTVQDMRVDLRIIRNLMQGDESGGEAREDDA